MHVGAVRCRRCSAPPQVSLDSSDVQHERLAVRLVSPVVPGVSVPPAPEPEERSQGVVDIRRAVREAAAREEESRKEGSKRTGEEGDQPNKKLKT